MKMTNVKDTGRILAEELAGSLVGGKLPCPIAFKVARKLNVAPKVVGDKADELGIRVINCQLGCFGVQKATHDELRDMQISAPVEEAIRAALINGKVPCEAAYGIASKLKVSRRKVGDTASKLDIRVSNCQLGCF